MAKPFTIRLTPADRKKLLQAYSTAGSHRQRVRTLICALPYPPNPDRAVVWT
jgi:hypothetical protein